MDLYEKLAREILLEADKTKTKTKQKAADAPKVDDRKANIATADKKPDKKGDEKAPLPGRVASRDETRSRRAADPALAGLAGTTIDPTVADHGDDFGDAEAPVPAPRPEPPELDRNLPVPLNRLPDRIRQDTGQDVELVWDLVRNLPGYGPESRGVTRDYFRMGVDEDVGRLKVATTITGANTPAMLRAFIAYIHRNGTLIDDFSHRLPDAVRVPPGMTVEYPEVKVYHCHGHAFLVQREEIEGMGRRMVNYYVYAAEGKGTATDRRVGGHTPPRIGRR